MAGTYFEDVRLQGFNVGLVLLVGIDDDKFAERGLHGPDFSNPSFFFISNPNRPSKE